MAISLVSLSLSSHGHTSSRLFHTSTISPVPTKPQNLKFVPRSISPPSSDSADPLIEDAVADNFPSSGCKACGKEEIERGCNGEGTIQGGIATVPGFGWWPIKAYRPCPAFVASGGRYYRRGQSMDEVAFGRGSPATPPSPVVQTDSEDLDRKKRRDSRRFKQ